MQRQLELINGPWVTRGRDYREGGARGEMERQTTSEAIATCFRNSVRHNTGSEHKTGSASRIAKLKTEQTGHKWVCPESKSDRMCTWAPIKRSRSSKPIKRRSTRSLDM